MAVLAEMTLVNQVSLRVWGCVIVTINFDAPSSKHITQTYSIDDVNINPQINLQSCPHNQEVSVRKRSPYLSLNDFILT